MTPAETPHEIATETPPRESNVGLLDGWMSRAELADALGVCVDTLIRWERRRYGPKCVKAGRKALYKCSTVLTWLEAQESAAPEIETPRGTRQAHKTARPPRAPRIGGRAA